MYIGFEVRIMVIGTDCTGSCKSNYLTIMTSVSVFRWVGGFFRVVSFTPQRKTKQQIRDLA